MGGGGGDTISSFSVWYPWSNSQNTQEDLVREIATTTHQLITRGTEVRFQWVPAHVCLPGNDSKRRIEQQKEEPRELTPQQWRWKSAWPMYICGTNQAGMEAVGGVPPNGHGQGVGRHLSPLQGRSLLPWNSNLPSLHHTLSARGHLEMHVRTDEVWVWNERLVSPRDVLRHLMFRPLPTIDWETTQHGTAPVYKMPGSVRPAWRMEPLAGCSKTGLHLSTGSLPVVGRTTGYVQHFPATRVNPGSGGRGERLRVSHTQL